MRSPRSVLLLAVGVLIASSASLFTAGRNIPITGDATLPVSMTAFSLSLFTLLAAALTLSRQGHAGAHPDFDKIREITGHYFGKKRLDTGKLVNHLLPYIEDMIRNDSDYLHGLPKDMQGVLYDIYNSSKAGSHGHFNPRRAEMYVRKLSKGLGAMYG